MTDFTKLTDEQVLGYLASHYEEMGTGGPPEGFPDNLRKGLVNAHISIERLPNAFAIVAHANRKHHRPFIRIPPQADLIILYVAPERRAKGVGMQLLNEVKMKYMEDQGMELVCAGSRRKAFFEKSGFVVKAITVHGLYHMWCDPVIKK